MFKSVMWVTVNRSGFVFLRIGKLKSIIIMPQVMWLLIIIQVI